MAVKITGTEYVQNLLGDAWADVHTFIQRNVASNSDLLSYLSATADYLRDQEQRLYDALGLPNIQAVNALLKSDIFANLDALNAGGIIIRTIDQNYTYSGNSDEKLESDIFQLFDEYLTNTQGSNYMANYVARDETDENVIVQAFISALNDAINNIPMSNKNFALQWTMETRSRTGKYSKTENIGDSTIRLSLQSVFENSRIKLKLKDGHIKVEGTPVQFNSTLQYFINEHIRPELMKRLDKTWDVKMPLANLPLNELRNLVNNLIEEYVPLDPYTRSISNTISIGANKSAIEGYLGEIQARLYFRKLFPTVTDERIVNTGAQHIRTRGGVQEDPADLRIDLINDIFNIQIKNYTGSSAHWGGASKFLSGNQEIHETSSAASFLLNRLQVDSPALMTFFGAATWHAPNPEYANESTYKDYKDIYAGFDAIFNELKADFDTFLPNIIRLTTYLTDLGELEYQNFYFTKGMLVPSSAIIDGIVDAITGLTQGDRAIYTSSYSMHSGQSHYTHALPYLGNYNDYQNFANQTAIKWSVTLNFRSVLRSLGL